MESKIDGKPIFACRYSLKIQVKISNCVSVWGIPPGNTWRVLMLGLAFRVRVRVGVRVRV
jgi:hypothetical protein